MTSGPPVRRAIQWDADVWARLERLALEMGTSPEQLLQRVAAKLTVSEGRLSLERDA